MSSTGCTCAQQQLTEITQKTFASLSRNSEEKEKKKRKKKRNAFAKVFMKYNKYFN